MEHHRGRLLAFLLGTLSLAGCGTLNHHARHQYILVQSNPSGAPIYYRGERLGVTPMFVDVRRGRHETVEVGDTSSRRSLPIPYKYRWEGSFWSNFAWLYFAPAGWIVDFSSGGAWNMKDPEVPTLKGQRSLPSKLSDRIVIAPPTAVNADVADEGGLLWEKELAHRYPKWRFAPYGETLSEFAREGYDFDQKPSRTTEYELFARLKVSTVFESEFKETDDGVQFIGRTRNVFTNHTGTEQVIDAAPVEAGREAPWLERFKSLVHLVPNTVGIEWSESDTELKTTDDVTFRSKPSMGSTVWDQAVPYLSAISLSRLTPPRREAAGKFNFEFVPSLRTSYRIISFPTFPQIQENEFSYLNIGAGLGPEIGWQSGPHYFYLNFIPMLGWHRLDWVADDVHHTISIGAITSRSELGYLYFLTDRFSGRLFFKSTSTPQDMWNSAIQSISPGAPTVNSGTDVVTFAVQFSYTWQPRRQISKWVIKKH